MGRFNESFWIYVATIFVTVNLFLFSQDVVQSSGIRLTGKVISKMTQSPLEKVTVRVMGTQLGAITKNDGSFSINNIPPGIYQIQFSILGYETYVQTDVAISSGRPIMLEIALAEKIIELEGAEVKASFFDKKIETVTSTQTLNFEDIRRAPGVQEDVIRATALLPGVGVTAAGRNDLIVRGGAPFENLFIVDNLEVANINHFGSQGSTGGPLSIINLDFVRSVDFSAGGFGARYGDKTSSITNITLRNGNEEAFGGQLNLSATGFGLNLEGPISDKGSYLFSARRSYLDLIFTLAGFGFIPEYWDFQGKVNYRLDQKNTLSYLFVSAINDVKLNNDDEDKIYKNSRVAVPSQYQNFQGLTWKHLFNSGFTTVTLGTIYTRYETFQNDSNLVEQLRNESREVEFVLKTDVDYQVGPKTTLNFGNQVKYAGILEYNIYIAGKYRVDNFGTPQELKTDTTLKAYKNGTYFSLTHGIGQHKFSIGGRMDYFNYTNDKLYFSPRLSAIYTINENSAIVFSAGRYYQSPSYIWTIGSSTQKLNAITADQIVLGYSHTPLEDVKVQLEVFYKSYSNYPTRVYRPQAVLAPSGFDDASSDIPFGLEPLTNDGTGNVRGAELFIQKKLSEIPIYGLLSLSYSESLFKALDGVERPGVFDSRWIFNIALGWRIDNNWEVSSKWRAATGVPTTPFLPTGQKDFSQYNEGERLPLFNSLDLRVERRWNFESMALITYIDIQNLYGQKNVSNIRWDYREMKPEKQESIGVLPSIGVSLEF